MVPTTLFKSVRSSSHEQSVPTCMNKPVNNTVQAGLLNHVQAGQLNHVQAYKNMIAGAELKTVGSLLKV